MARQMPAWLARLNGGRWFVIASLPVVFGLTLATGLLLRRHYAAVLLVPWAGMALTACATVNALLHLRLSRRKEWQEPLQKLQQALSEVAGGDAPIEHVSGIPGPLAPLAGQIQEVLKELKRTRAQVVQAESDLRQRVCQRTDALERLIASLRMQANRDSLTALFNRRMYDQHMPDLFERIREDGRSLCVIQLDLDNFKLLNDTIGHHAGDEFLRNVGQIIRSTVRGQDLAFRMGGDEFLVAMPDATAEAGVTLARRLTSLVDALGKAYKLDRPLGLSAGCAALGETPCQSLQQLIDTADERLYEAKTRRKGQDAPHRKAG